MNKKENNEQESRIEALKKNLYSRTDETVSRSQNPTFREKEYDVKDDWEHATIEREEVKLNDEYNVSENNFFKKFFIGSIVFFLLALALGGLILLRGSNVVSADNVDITVVGPASIAGGNVLSLDVNVLNKNNIKLELVDLSVEFPSGTANPENPSEEFRRFRETLPDIDPGQSVKKTINAILYGEENSKKEIRIKVEYRVKNSNAIFYKEKIYEAFINSSPVSLEINSFKELNSNQEFDITATVTSNSKEVLKNILLRAEYPFGFTFVSADPKPTFDNNVWKIGDLQPGTKRIIKLRAKIEGQDEEERVAKFTIGTQSTRNEKLVGTQFVATSQIFKIKKPFLAVQLSLDGSTGGADFVAEPGKEIRGDISWVNNLPTNINDAEITLTFSGTAVDKESITSDRGFYRSSENSIVWNQRNTDSLDSISPGQQGRVGFSFRPKTPSGGINPTMTIDISVKAARASEQNVPENITSTVKKVVKVIPDLELSGQTLRTQGPFANTGPIPPRADQMSTYTIVWTVSNTSSNIANAEVRTTLPSYVKWLGEIEPSGEKMTYLSSTGELIWKVGDVKAYAGYTSPRRQVAFQIGFEPSISQVGEVSTLVNEATLTAQDQFTGATIRTNRAELTTRFSTDPAYRSGDEEVIR